MLPHLLTCMSITSKYEIWDTLANLLCALLRCVIIAFILNVSLLHSKAALSWHYQICLLSEKISCFFYLGINRDKRPSKRCRNEAVRRCRIEEVLVCLRPRIALSSSPLDIHAFAIAWHQGSLPLLVVFLACLTFGDIYTMKLYNPWRGVKVASKTLVALFLLTYKEGSKSMPMWGNSSSPCRALLASGILHCWTSKHHHVDIHMDKCWVVWSSMFQ